MYIDSGAMYRLITLNALNDKMPEKDQVKNFDRVRELAHKLNIRYESKCVGGSNDETNIQLRVFQNDSDVSEAIRTPQVTKNVALIASDPIVRDKVLMWQRKLATETKSRGVVMDGRDIGTTVWPNANLKIFLNADPMERARRRWEELKTKHSDVKLETVLEDIKKRDDVDVNRKISPLKKAPDAIEVDATHMTPLERVVLIEKLAYERGLKE